MDKSFYPLIFKTILNNSFNPRCGIAMDAWMFPLGQEQYFDTVSQPVLFVNTETFQWKKNMRPIKEFLNIETVGR